MVIYFIVVVFFRQVFCDFGKDFVVVDNDGETPVSCMISAVTQVNTSYYNQTGQCTAYCLSILFTHRIKRVWSRAWRRRDTAFKPVTLSLLPK